VARELARYKLDLVGVRKVRWDKDGSVRAGAYISLYVQGSESHQLGIGFFVHRIISTVKRVQCVSDRISYISLRGCWCNIVVLNMHDQVRKK
jgi:hypothetical protein